MKQPAFHTLFHVVNYVDVVAGSWHSFFKLLYVMHVCACVRWSSAAIWHNVGVQGNASKGSKFPRPPGRRSFSRGVPPELFTQAQREELAAESRATRQQDSTKKPEEPPACTCGQKRKKAQAAKNK